MPKEFNISGTLSSKILSLNRRYDAIMIIGQNFLIPLQAKMYLENNHLLVNENRFHIANNNYPFVINEIHSLEGSKMSRLNLEHLNSEEKPLITKILKEYEDLFYKERDKLTFTHEVHHEIVTNTDRPIYSKIL